MTTKDTITLLREVEAALESCRLFAGCEREYDEQLVDDAKDTIQELIRRASVAPSADENICPQCAYKMMRNMCVAYGIEPDKFLQKPLPAPVPVASVDDNYALIRVGPHRKVLRNSMDDTYTLKVEKRGDVAVFTIRREYPEGPFYKKPEIFCFAVDCELAEPPQAKSGDL